CTLRLQPFQVIGPEVNDLLVVLRSTQDGLDKGTLRNLGGSSWPETNWPVAASQRWPGIVHPLALDVSDLLLAYTETGRDVLPGLDHAHGVVLGVHQTQDPFLALVLGQWSVDHGGMPPSGRRLAEAVDAMPG